MNIRKIVSINNITINRKRMHIKHAHLFNPVFFMLSIVKSFEVLPKNNGYRFISESFALN